MVPYRFQQNALNEVTSKPSTNSTSCVNGRGNITKCVFRLRRDSTEYLVMFFSDILLFYLIPGWQRERLFIFSQLLYSAGHINCVRGCRHCRCL